eukprot:3577680-Pyramimonas_sp.AAC.1
MSCASPSKSPSLSSYSPRLALSTVASFASDLGLRAEAFPDSASGRHLRVLQDNVLAPEFRQLLLGDCHGPPTEVQTDADLASEGAEINGKRVPRTLHHDRASIRDEVKVFHLGDPLVYAELHGIEAVLGKIASGDPLVAQLLDQLGNLPARLPNEGERPNV